jgi:hypothetical protein
LGLFLCVAMHKSEQIELWAGKARRASEGLEHGQQPFDDQ